MRTLLYVTSWAVCTALAVYGVWFLSTLGSTPGLVV